MEDVAAPAAAAGGGGAGGGVRGGAADGEWVAAWLARRRPSGVTRRSSLGLRLALCPVHTVRPDTT